MEDEDSISTRSRAVLWSATILLFAAATGVQLLVQGALSKKWFTVPENLQVPAIFSVWLLPGLVAAALAVHAHFGVHRRGHAAPSATAVFILVVITVAAVLGGIFGSVYLWDD